MEFCQSEKVGTLHMVPRTCSNFLTWGAPLPPTLSSQTCLNLLTYYKPAVGLWLKDLLVNFNLLILNSWIFILKERFTHNEIQPDFLLKNIDQLFSP